MSLPTIRILVGLRKYPNDPKSTLKNWNDRTYFLVSVDFRSFLFQDPIRRIEASLTEPSKIYVIRRYMVAVNEKVRDIRIISGANLS